MNEKKCAGCGECKCGETSERVKAVRLVEIDYDRRLAGQTAEEVAWFEAEVLSDRGLLLLHSNNIGATVGKVRVLSTQPADADRAEALLSEERIIMIARNLGWDMQYATTTADAVELARAVEAEVARRLAAAPAVPEGWKLVPPGASMEMIDAFLDAPSTYCQLETFQTGYRAMLAAAPAPEGGAA